MTLTIEAGFALAFAGILVGWGISWGLMHGQMATMNRLIHEWRKSDDEIHHDHEDRIRKLEVVRAERR